MLRFWPLLLCFAAPSLAPVVQALIDGALR